jgi:HD-GYP domain-containing protein (c-di-GMP phosphodiesterase class II)
MSIRLKTTTRGADARTRERTRSRRERAKAERMTSKQDAPEVRSGAAGDAGDHRWQGRPWLARAVRWSVMVVPFVASVVTAYVLSRALPPAANTAWLVARLAAIAGSATVALKLSDRLMRRFLPLAALLDLTLLFPDQAPSRYKIALRNGASNIELHERVERYARGGRQDNAAAAEHLLDLVAALSRHDRITRGHSERVRAYTQMIADEMGVSGAELDRLRWAGLIHDVGKLRVPIEILNKPGKLTDAEFEIIKQHPAWGAELAAPLAPWLGGAVQAVVEHHEKWDGSGYPRGLRGTEISEAGRIVAVADVFDVMTSARSYKHARSPMDARAELARCAGSHFDPAVVRAFMNISIGRLRRVMGPLSWLAQLSLFPQSLFATATNSAAAASAGASGVTGAFPALLSTVATGAIGVAATVGVAAAADLPIRAEQVTVVEAGLAGASQGAAPVSDVGESAAGAAARVPEIFVLDTTTTDTVSTPDGSESVVSVDAASAESTAVPADGAPGVPAQVPPPVGDPAPAGLAPGDTTSPAAAPAQAPEDVAPAAPVPEATTATTVPPPVTPVTPVTPAPTTTVAAGLSITNKVLLFAAPTTGDTTSSPVLPLADRVLPQQVGLPNYDVDRDGSPGLHLLRGGALDPTDPTRLQRFAYDPAGAAVIDGRHRITVWAAPTDDHHGLQITAAIALCDDATGACTVLDSASASRDNESSGFQPYRIDLARRQISVAATQHVEVWVALDGSSGSDAELAYDAGAYLSSWWIRP